MMKMLTAAKIAGVDNFANAHPRGYDMEVGEKGEGLSGGQIQSVGISRACLFDYPINLLMSQQVLWISKQKIMF